MAVSKEIKICPFCGEEILAIAIKCKHCGSMLGEGAKTSSTTIIEAFSSQYEIIEEAGRGGMAIVYKARQKSLDRIVALKVIPKELTHDREFVSRFQREAIDAGKLNHRNLITIYDSGKIGGYPYMAMEFLEGGTLGAVIRRRYSQTEKAQGIRHKAQVKEKGERRKEKGFKEEEIKGILIPILEGLQYAHNRGIIHRDIKSSNIMFDREGRPVLMDFGIAKLQDSTPLTRTGTYLGTPEYSSPEQVDTEAEIDHRTDIYSLGVVAYEMAVGKPPFTGDNPLAVIKDITWKIPTNVGELNNSLSRGLSNTIMRALTKDKNKRYKNCKEFLKALKRGESLDPLESQKKRTTEKAPPKKLKPVSRPIKVKTDPKRMLLGIIFLITAFIIVLSILYGIKSTSDTQNIDTDDTDSVIVSTVVSSNNTLIQLISNAEKYFREGKILEPYGENALALTQKVLRHEPENVRAQTLKSQIAEYFEDEGDKAMNNNLYQIAIENYQQSLEIIPYYNDVKEKLETTQRIWEDADLQAFEQAKDLNTIPAYEQYLSNFPQGIYSLEVQRRINTLNEENSRREQENMTRYENRMIYVEGGTFEMGCTLEQYDCDSDEKPVHEVTLRSFYISKFEITQKLWKQIMGDNPSRFSDCENCPVENVSWNDVQSFIQKLNQQTGLNYRLPTEAEWEFAAKGGNRSNGYLYSGGNNINEIAWYDGNSNRVTHPVGEKKSNELGLYDMTGNVLEWCNDRYGNYSDYSQYNPQGSRSGSNRIYRGGCWTNDTQVSRVSNRYNRGPNYKFSGLGFRLCLDN